MLANAGVSIREFVRPYNNPAAIDIVTTLYVKDMAKFCFIFLKEYVLTLTHKGDALGHFS